MNRCGHFAAGSAGLVDVRSDEIKAAYVLTQNPLSAVPRRLKDVVRRMAMLGGFLARKGDGEPGVKTIWVGLQRIVDFPVGVRFMRESDDGTSCVQWNGFTVHFISN